MSVWCGQVWTDYGLSRRTTTLVSLARHARSCGLNLAAQTALFRCFSQVGNSDFLQSAAANGARGLLGPGGGALLRAAANLRFSQVEHQLHTIEI